MEESNIFYRLLNALIELGGKIAETATSVVDLFTDPILKLGALGDYTLLDLMLTLFFVTYVPYQIIKWINPF